MPVCGSNVPLVVGQRYDKQISNAQAQVFNQPFVVLREATEEEWRQGLRDEGVPEDQLDADPDWTNFYDVSTD